MFPSFGFPAHVGVEGNEIVDFLAKESIKHEIVYIEIPLCRTEIKTIIKGHTNKIWQEYWDIIDTGRHLYNIQKQVVISNIRCNRNPKEEKIITHLRIGHAGLNCTLQRIGKHLTGLCSHCNTQETVKHILLDYKRYKEERRELEKLENKT